ncbi:MAG: DNA methylase [Phenylobacterium sp. SCN 69-14]|nr:MAG: DNA methylase [Phenylobacterium sp. SCN 69-14]
MTELVFKGKEFVFNHHLTVPFRPLEMHPEKGVGAPSLDSNLIIHGDNLHALKALLPTHAGKVDCIFIDPPYNTGNEGWSYNDNVNSPMIKEWLSANPIGVEDGLRHDKWACMMWPRLKLLHELLAESGSLWVTLDDNEAHRAKLILDEIFGESNFLANFVWQSKDTPGNNSSGVAETHNHILFYRKSEYFSSNMKDRSEDQIANYSNPDRDPRGPWLGTPLTRAEHRDRDFYPIDGPNGRKVSPPTGTSWRRPPEKMAWLETDKRIWWGVDGSAEFPKEKKFLSEVKDQVVNQTWWPYQFAGSTRNAGSDIKDIFHGEKVFDTPKPKRLLERILDVATDPSSVVLDSFAGSGTTAHAVLAANARDGGNRRFILVEGENYADTLTAERVRRVINGYAFKGTQREELLREPLTRAKLRNATALHEKVQRCETLDGRRFDRIKTEVKDGALIVTGERAVKERAPGLGGGFTYCTLGAPIDMEGLLTGADLPDARAVAALLYHTATAKPFDPAAMSEAPEIGEGVARLGEGAGRTLWLIYRPDLEWLKSGAAALTLARARAIAATAPGDHLVFAPAKFVSRELLAAEKLAVEYAPLPFALYRVEMA